MAKSMNKCFPAVDNFVENSVEIYFIIHSKQTKAQKMRISTAFSYGFQQIFHRYLAEKVINLLTLRPKVNMLITGLTV